MTTYIEFLKLAAVIGRTGMSRSAIYSAMRSGDFPASDKLGPRAVAWASSDIAEWQQSRINASRKAV